MAGVPDEEIEAGGGEETLDGETRSGWGAEGELGAVDGAGGTGQPAAAGLFFDVMTRGQVGDAEGVFRSLLFEGDGAAASGDVLVGTLDPVFAPEVSRIGPGIHAGIKAGKGEGGGEREQKSRSWTTKSGRPTSHLRRQK